MEGSESQSGTALLGQAIRQASPAERTWILLQLLTPLGIPLAVHGAFADNATTLLIGFILLGVFVIDTAVLLPLLMVRAQRRQREERGPAAPPPPRRPPRR